MLSCKYTMLYTQIHKRNWGNKFNSSGIKTLQAFEKCILNQKRKSSVYYNESLVAFPLSDQCMYFTLLIPGVSD